MRNLKTAALMFTALSSLSLNAAAPSVDALAGESDRMIRFAEGFSGQGRGELEESIVRSNRKARSPLTITKSRDSDSTTSSVGLGESWVFSASTDLFYDFDADGYFNTLRVRFDVDSYLANAYVFAELYLSWDGENWERYFVTEDFLIQGSTFADEYEVETEFVTGYPTGLYDILIEIYDADFGTFMDEYGPFQSSDFSILPIEDVEHDGVPPTPAVTVTHEHGGGSISLLWILFLSGGLLFRYRNRPLI